MTTSTGKAFEYACAYVLFKKYSTQTEATLVDSPQCKTASNAFAGLPGDEQDKYIKAAEAGVKIIDRLEPRLSDPSGPMTISLQTDSAGIAGDVRDVLCIRGDEWEIGLSCKHNHEAVKHSRLSDMIDFGHDWFQRNCSDQYNFEVQRIFGPLRALRYESRLSGNPARWNSLPDKEGSIYVPVLQAFMAELQRLDTTYPGEIPAKLIQYLIGRNDFYKVIMNEQRGYTKIDAVNIQGTLNAPLGRQKALINVPALKLPSKFYEIGFKDGSKNTIFVVCDEGWNASMRIHNASSKIEPSLKFDVRLLAMPSSLLSQIEPWPDQ
ncbi:MAG: HaeIII family restriction endonuclease [Lachnospiraceae bacterium]|nr:HaeIII family restriction endonuclease [Lachnospiraceae bacterium]